MISSHAAAGVALIEAGVLAVTPAVVPPDVVAAPAPQVRLAADSIANIPVNLFQTIVNMPANQVQAIQDFADAGNYGGNAWSYSPIHLEGWDPGDSPEVTAGVNALLPIPALSNSIADQLNIILQAELPPSAGCPGFAGLCPDPIELFAGWFRVPLTHLLAGYTFPEIENPLEFPDGTTQPIPWSGATVQLEPLEPLRAFGESLLQEPTGIKVVTPQQTVATYKNLGESLNVAFNFFAEGSVFLQPKILGPIAYPFLALEPVLGWTAPDPDLAAPKHAGEPEKHVVTIDLPSLLPHQGVSQLDQSDTTILPKRPLRSDKQTNAGGAVDKASKTELAPALPKLLKWPRRIAGSDAVNSYGRHAAVSESQATPGGTIARAIKATRDKVSASLSKSEPTGRHHRE